MMLLGSWKRPYAYTAPNEEHRAVRERVGIIDVSTLGKLEVKGKDAAQLLDRVYTHTFSTLRTGRIRYGVMCDDSGIIIDDGTVSRLADDHFFLTTTTGNVEFVGTMAQMVDSRHGPVRAGDQCDRWAGGHEHRRPVRQAGVQSDHG